MFPRRNCLFDNPVFQGVEGDDTESPAGIQPVRCRLHHALHFAEFIVDLNADRLEAALGRMLFLPQGCRRHCASDDLRQFHCRVDRVFPALSDNFRTDPAGIAFLPVEEKNPAQLRFFIAIDDLPGGFCLAAVHPHIQRRGDAEVENHSVYRGDGELIQNLSQSGKASVDQPDAVSENLQPLPGPLDCSLVPIDPDQDSAREP